MQRNRLRALSSANASYRAQAATKRRVEEILSWIHIVPDRVAVPGFGAANMDHQDDDAGEHYRAALEAAGLQVAVITEPRPGFKSGYVLGVSPGPGTMVDPGDAVSMTEIAEPRGPARRSTRGGQLGRSGRQHGPSGLE